MLTTPSYSTSASRGRGWTHLGRLVFGVDVLLLALLLLRLVLGGLLLVPLGVLLAPVLEEVEDAQSAERDGADNYAWLSVALRTCVATGAGGWS